ncbi:hypothetical protein SSP35_09_00290 [Streptomyces sp. NBRC 110611]|uniref:hypothetical protein n=1 Tax=Streptomyces sp. NBRC 110611 TaxID=1621259 RepID=UPI000829B3C2|nr:hypothetical protein [Streptomyces sp. NBRC 110611]GAU68786.1 hypothetical protein SSP35_09_00290 [Streptomyces sp. NBRC 110611]
MGLHEEHTEPEPAGASRDVDVITPESPEAPQGITPGSEHAVGPSRPATAVGTVFVSGMHSGPNPSPGLSVARSLRLAQPDLRIVGLDYSRESSGLHSALLDDLVCLPAWREAHLATWIKQMDRLLEPEDAVLIPCLDLEVRLLARELGAHSRILGPPKPALELVGKPPVEAAERLGLRTPEYETDTSWQAVDTFIRRSPYGVWVKGQHYDAHRAHTAGAALSLGDVVQRTWGGNWHLEAHVAGQECSIAFCALDGRLLDAVFITKAMVTTEGKTWAGEVAELDAAMRDRLAGLLADARWTGGGELELIRSWSGELTLMEINPRLPAWIHGASVCGANLPAALVTGEPADPGRRLTPGFTRVVEEIPVHPALGITPIAWVAGGISRPGDKRHSGMPSLGQRRLLPHEGAELTEEQLESPPNPSLTPNLSSSLAAAAHVDGTVASEAEAVAREAEAVVRGAETVVSEAEAVVREAESAGRAGGSVAGAPARGRSDGPDVPAVPAADASAVPRGASDIPADEPPVPADAAAVRTGGFEKLLGPPGNAATPYRQMLLPLFTERVRALRQEVDGVGRVLLAHSVKTCPQPAVLREAARLGLAAEAISLAELEAADRYGLAAERAILNGPAKWWPATDRVRCFAFFADSTAELTAVHALLDSGFQLEAEVVGVRVAPAGLVSRFGVPLHERDSMAETARLLRTLADRLGARWGLHFHYAQSVLGAPRWQRECATALSAADPLADQLGGPPAVLDIGGGWHVDDLPCLRASLEYVLAHGPDAARDGDPLLVMEPGKLLTQPSAAVVTQVLAHRGSHRGEDIVVDAAEGDMPEAPFHPHPVARFDGSRWVPLRPGGSWIFGRSCMEHDVLSVRLDLGDVRDGDYLAFGMCGGYDTSMAYDFGRGTAPRELGQ